MGTDGFLALSPYALTLTPLECNWPVSTIGSVSDYDYIGNQEVAGSSPVLVIFLQSSRPYGQIVHYAIPIKFCRPAHEFWPNLGLALFFNITRSTMHSYEWVQIDRTRGTN